MNIRNIVGIMSGMIISTVLLSSIEGHSAGTNPITMTDLQSTGSYVFDGDGSNDVKLYKSDLRNIYNEIDALGAYTDEELTNTNTRITNLSNDVTSGKTKLKNKINSYKSGTITADTPTFAQLKAGVDTVYTTGVAKGKADSVPKTLSKDLTVAEGDTGSISCTVPSNAKKAYVTVSLYNGLARNSNSGSGYATVGGSTRVNGAGTWSGAVSAGSTIYISLDNSGSQVESDLYGNIRVFYWQ